MGWRSERLLTSEEESREGGQSVQCPDKNKTATVPFSWILFIQEQKKDLFAKYVIINCVTAVQFWFCFQYPVKPRPGLRPTTPNSRPRSFCASWGKLSTVMLATRTWSAWRAVDGLGCVILEERLQKHAHCAEHTHKHKNPQEEPVNHHGDVLPVLAHLWIWGSGRGGRPKQRLR